MFIEEVSTTEIIEQSSSRPDDILSSNLEITDTKVTFMKARSFSRNDIHGDMGLISDDNHLFDDSFTLVCLGKLDLNQIEKITDHLQKAFPTQYVDKLFWSCCQRLTNFFTPVTYTIVRPIGLKTDERIRIRWRSTSFDIDGKKIVGGKV